MDLKIKSYSNKIKLFTLKQLTLQQKIKINMKNSIYYLAFGILLFASSCSAPKKTIYFNKNEKQDSTRIVTNIQPRPEVIITPDDIIAISISSVDAFSSQKEPVNIFNEGGVPYNVSAQGGSTGGVKGFLVDQEGNIDFPVLGKIKFSGLNLTEAKDMMSKKLSQYLKSPVVEIRLLNFKVNMIGEIGRIGPVVAPNQKLNIIEAIASAGDIPITGRKDNVLIIREENGKRIFGRVNLNSKSVFESPYYYLQKNDIVYVEANKIKRQQTNEFLQFYLPVFSTLIGSVLSIYGIVQLTKN